MVMTNDRHHEAASATLHMSNMLWHPQWTHQGDKGTQEAQVIVLNAADAAYATTLCLFVYLLWAAVTWPNRRRLVRMLIGIPPRTSLRTIARHEGLWVVWTGIDDMQKPYAEWRGTYIALYDNGTAYSMTVQPDGTEDCIRIK